MRDYELMWILPGESSEEDGKKSVEVISALVTEKGGKVKSSGLWGRRTLSYPIKKSSEGAYYLARFSVDATAAPDLNRAMEADQGVLRHLLVKEERKKAVKAES
ncbi:MAG: 30S ribosomal protein S6 [Chloroflexi bacterium]|nr:30S ribosomal protein S6 [Chloroflexota bacterium]